MELPSHFEAKYITRCSVLQGTCQNMPVMTPPPPLYPPKEHGKPASCEDPTTGRSAWRKGGGSTVSGFRGTPLHLGVSRFCFVCGFGLDEGGMCTQRYLQCPWGRGSQDWVGCEGPSLRCLPGLRLHLGERNQDRCLFRLSRALPHPEEQGWNAVGHGSDTLGYRKPLPVRRGPMLLSPRVLLRSAWSSREIRTRGQRHRGNLPQDLPKEGNLLRLLPV